ncbi:MAG: cytochrome C oxidase subunit IV family protein [Phycisphaerales bacterium]
MAHAANHFNESNPHGEKHHGHPIIPPITLTTVLGFLLLFTLLTVGLAQLEVWIQDYFRISLPHWVNIAIAMSIATVKAVMVMAIFMQLRYDNAMNTIVMLFTFFAVGLFLFFSGLDLFTRDRVTPWKAEYVVQGGTGFMVAQANGKPIVQAARDRAITLWGPEKFAKIEAATNAAHGHAGEDFQYSTADRSRAPKGVVVPRAAHGAPHDEHAAGEHEAPAGH